MWRAFSATGPCRHSGLPTTAFEANTRNVPFHISPLGLKGSVALGRIDSRNVSIPAMKNVRRRPSRTPLGVRAKKHKNNFWVHGPTNIGS